MLVETTAPTAFRSARQDLLAAPWQDPAARRLALSDLTDSWLQSLFTTAEAPSRGVALVAIGGYGRRELSPGSDVDLLLLAAGTIARTTAEDGETRLLFALVSPYADPPERHLAVLADLTRTIQRQETVEELLLADNAATLGRILAGAFSLNR